MSNQSLHERRSRAMAQGQGALYPVYVDKARNAEIWDIEGNRYIDFGAGIAVNNTGHNHPKIQAAVQAQVERFSHTCLMVTPYGTAVELAEKLNAAAFGPFPGEIYHAPYPNAYHGISVADSLAALDDLFTCDIEPNRVAAIIIEPVQGEGGH